MLRFILIGALFIAVLVVIFRIVAGTPGMRQMIEGFQTKTTPAPSTLNTVTECPAGTQLYMYDGAAYCCNGQVNPDADDINLTCKPLMSRNFNLTFCTLGPPRETVPNCMELRVGQMTAVGEEYCPPTLPNFVQPAGSQGRCCKSLANAAFTDCADTSAPNSFCDMSSNNNIFMSPTACPFLRLKADAAAQCPAGYSPFTVGKSSGPFEGMTLIGCSGDHDTCYPQTVIDRLKGSGQDVGTLTVCPAAASTP
jgi:hypothetical protein